MSPLVSLSKMTVERYVKDGIITEVPKKFPKKFLTKKMGVFVTIEKNKKLRACIGTPLPVEKNIIEEVVQNSVAAATKDYRFGEIKEEELKNLTYTVYLLHKPEPVRNISLLNPQKYGIIIKTVNPPNKDSLLLPGLKGIKTAQQQIITICRKAGINPEKEEFLIYRFKVNKFE